MSRVSTAEIAAISVCLFSIIIYHFFYFYFVLYKSPDSTRLTSNFKNAYLWVSKHFAKSDAATCTMGLHQLRNIILVGIFVGGNSFSIAYAYLNNFPSQGGAETVSGIRSIIIATFLFFSFLSWAMVIRCASHLGYLLGASVDDEVDDAVGVSYIQRMDFLANNMSYHFAIGFRFIFVSIPFALLGAGISALVISTFFLLVFLFEFDHFAHHNNSTEI